MKRKDNGPHFNSRIPPQGRFAAGRTDFACQMVDNIGTVGQDSCLGQQLEYGKS
ncbi:hypothetical protein [Granulosicoccus sp. 3-233]|uniref:hypothetical protein n=1 Tax=Granulosicoccus sp. 3-233 TaxID=3417969 RepID=UPI003D3484F5